MANEESFCIVNIIVDGLQKVTLNRPKKKNAITSSMYKELTSILNDSARDENVHMLTLTGSGDFYSSGNDIISTSNEFDSNDPSININNGMKIFKNFIDSLIVYPKLLVAIVNGPAIGIAVTTLGLFDMVYASDKAYFHTPFSTLGLTAEGCSTYTFPKIMGTSKAGDMLYLGYKMNAMEAKQCGLISEVYKHNELDKVWTYLKRISTLSIQSITMTKRLVKRWDQKMLLDVNAKEVEQSIRQFESTDFLERFTMFLSRKSKM